MTTTDTRIPTPLAARILTTPRRAGAEPLWTSQVPPSEALLEPAVVGDTVVTASGRTVPQNPRVAAGGEGVFVGTSDGQVLAFDKAGEVCWSSRAQDGVVAHLAVAGEDLLVTGTGRESRVEVLDAATGATRWEGPSRGTRLTAPVAAGQGVVVAAEGWSLYAFQDRRIREAREIREALAAKAPEIRESASTVLIGGVELSIRGA